MVELVDRGRPRRWPSRWVIATLAAILLFGSGLAAWLRWPARELEISSETTRLTQPLNDDGSVDYALALDREAKAGVTGENNALGPLLLAFGPGLVTAGKCDAVCRELGIDPPPPNGKYFVSVTDFGDRHGMTWEQVSKLQDQLANASQDYWDPTQCPRLLEWLQVNEQPLQQIAQASRRTRFYIPRAIGPGPHKLVDTAPPDHGVFCDAVRAFQARAFCCIQDGDLNGGWEGLLTAMRLARLVRQAGTSLGGLLALHIEVPTCAALRRLAERSEFTAEVGRVILRELADPTVLADPAWHIDKPERFVMLEAFQTVARQVPTAPDKDKVLRGINSLADEAVAAFNEPTWSARKTAIDAFRARCTREANVNAFSSDKAKMLMLPAMGLGEIAEYWTGKAESAEAHRRLTQIAVALAIHQLADGGFPDKLNSLAPDPLPSRPTDPFTDGQFVYRRTDDGYLLYSVGENMTDDAGQGDDIAARVPTTQPRQTL